MLYLVLQLVMVGELNAILDNNLVPVHSFWGQERKVLIRKCMEARAKRLREARGRAAETRKRHRLAAEEAGMEGGAGATSP